MGMAASQASLLSITSRLHDIENESQRKQSIILQLATQQDAAFKKYNEALDAKKITVAYHGDTSTSYIDANFSTICGYNTQRNRDYVLTDNITGNIIVSHEIYECYQEFGNDKYSFAWAAMGFEGSDFHWNDPDMYSAEQMADGWEVGFGTASHDDYGEGTTGGHANCFMSGCERIAYDTYSQRYPELVNAYDNAVNVANDSDASMSDKQNALDNFRDKLYNLLGAEILALMNQDKQDLQNDENPNILYNNRTNWSAQTAEFRYYVALWEMINQAGGCQAMDSRYESGDEGTEWLNNMVNAGLVTISGRDRMDYGSGFKETTVSTSLGSNYLQYDEDDDYAKAQEVLYKHELDVIKRKEQKIDNELKNLDTEHSTLKELLDSIKTVRNDNVEKNFSIFS